MPAYDDDNLDALLRDHLATDLDPQCGRAEAAFLRYVNDPARGAGAGMTTATTLRLAPAAADDDRPDGLDDAPAGYPFRRGLRPFGGRIFGLIGVAAAAAVAVIVAGPALMQTARRAPTPVPVSPSTGVSTNPPPRPVPPAPLVPRGNFGEGWVRPPEQQQQQQAQPRPQHPPLLRYHRSQMLDDGPVILDDNTPARRLRHQQYLGAEWYDPDNRARVRLTLPREDVTILKMDTY